MSNIAIKVQNLSKIYRLGEIGTGTLSRDMERWFKTRILKQEDPFLKIGETNDRANKGSSDIVYSLRDINFEIQQGDAVGIIGRNGAGKSTLLKILSRVTTPTTGRINIKGRVASLLEVGTGFHPELTGRENIYLNGSILGMRKREIDRKLDEIIDFSGVERYIDTPVKRYSSGMYVRLAFAVAAHLETEILIVDEVLAVGDAEFQAKCLGRMQDVSENEGRTVLFVSHNLGAINRICKTGLLMSNGTILHNGNIGETLQYYTNLTNIDVSLRLNNVGIVEWGHEHRPGNNKCRLNAVSLIQNDITTCVIDNSKYFMISIDYEVLEDLEDFSVAINIIGSNGDIIVHTSDIFSFESESYFKRSKGFYKSEVLISKNILNVGEYSLNVSADVPGVEEIFYERTVMNFLIETTSVKSEKYNPKLWRGVIGPELFNWSVK